MSFKIARWTLVLLLPAAAGQAHQTKNYDINGGHYGPGGQYHCHLSGCQMTEHRYQRRRGLITDYRDREKFYLEEDWPHWVTVNGCQDARNAVLSATSQDPVSYATPRNCTVRMGRWVDAYSGEVFTRAPQLEIDHIIPPIYANATSGYQWDDGKRRAFANDPLNLIPVSRDSHRDKRDRPISSWEPREEFRCEYAAAWRDISEKYDLELVLRDRNLMQRILDECDTDASSSVEN